MACLVLVFSVRAYENAGHHGKASAGRGNHVAHNISVVVLAGPEKPTLALHDSGNSVINQSVEVFDSGSIKFCLVVSIENPLENLLEISVVGL